MTSGTSAGSTASALAPSCLAFDSTCRIAFASGGLASGIGRAPRPAAISSATSSGETTQVSQPGTESAASRTSSSIASVSAPRSSPVRAGDSRVFERESDLTGTATTRMTRG